MEIKYSVIRSSRKTMSMEMTSDGLLLRVPYRATKSQIEAFISQHLDWISKQEEKWQQRQKELSQLTPFTVEEINALADKAMKIIPERVEYYARLAGVTYGRITIRNQRSRWGSCSSKGNLNFNCLLMLTPPEVIDSVVVHELCHRKEMNHSQRFYAEVLKLFPDYYKWDKWLKDNGSTLLMRMR